MPSYDEPSLTTRNLNPTAPLPPELVQYGFPLVFVLLVATGVGFPSPEDVLLLALGYLCSFHRMDLLWVIPSAIGSVLLADSILYLIGRKIGHHVPRLPPLKWVLSEQRLARAERAFHGHGGKAIFLARFVPGVRAGTYFSAGTFRFSYGKMLLFDALATSLFVPAVIVVGFLFAKHFDILVKVVRDAQGLLAAAVVVGVVVWFIVRRRRRLASGRSKVIS